MNDHLRISIDIEDEFENDEDLQLIEAMKALGRDYIRKNSAHFAPTNEQLRRMNSNQRDCAYALIDLYVAENGTTNMGEVQQTSRKSEISSLADFEDAH